MAYSLTKSDLEEARNFFALNDLGREISESNDINEIITDFSSTKVLQGVAWRQVLGNLSIYSNAFSKSALTMISINDTINSVLAQLIDYIGDEFDSIDTSERDNIALLLSDSSSLIVELETKINSKKTIEIIDKETNEIAIKYIDVYSESEKANYRAQIAELKEEIEKLKNLLDKIDGLEAEYLKAFEKLNAVTADIKNFENFVDEIQPNVLPNN